jgi:hypothetical protein
MFAVTKLELQLHWPIAGFTSSYPATMISGVTVVQYKAAVLEKLS